jgi:hypothetical protein
MPIPMHEQSWARVAATTVFTTEPDSLIFSKQCSAQDGASGGAVVVKTYLMVSCEFDPEVLVYRRDLFGRRQPVEIIRGPIRGPSQIAIGP